MKNSETILEESGSVNLNEKREKCVKEVTALQKELENIDKKIKKTTPVSVWKFIAQPQGGLFVLGLENPDTGCGTKDYLLPTDYKGRGAFTVQELKEIAEGLIRLAGD